MTKDYSEYKITSTYSIKIKNKEKIDELASKENKNQSEIINEMIEKY